MSKNMAKWQIDVNDYSYEENLYSVKRLDEHNGLIWGKDYYYRNIRSFKTLEEAKKFVDDHFDFPLEIVRKMK